MDQDNPTRDVVEAKDDEHDPNDAGYDEEGEVGGLSDLLFFVGGLLKSEKFMEELGKWREAWEHRHSSAGELQQSRLGAQKEVAKDWNKRVERLWWGRMSLSAGVVAGICYLGAIERLAPEALVALLGAVVASLFVKPKDPASAVEAQKS